MSTLNEDLIKACSHGNLILAKLCLDLGADIHAGYGAPLRRASCLGHLDIVKYLLEQGVLVGDSILFAHLYGQDKIVDYLQSL